MTFDVLDDDDRVVDDPAHREEGGTPAIVESIRAGLVFQLKEAVGVPTIQARESEMLRRVMQSWRAEPALDILGNLAFWVATLRIATPLILGTLGVLLCERAGVPICKAPHCADCCDRALCFGPEEG